MKDLKGWGSGDEVLSLVGLFDSLYPWAMQEVKQSEQMKIWMYNSEAGRKRRSVSHKHIARNLMLGIE